MLSRILVFVKRHERYFVSFELSLNFKICAQKDLLALILCLFLFPFTCDNYKSFDATNIYLHLLRSSKNAFIMQSKSTFLEFLRGIHRYKFGHPRKFFRGEIIQREWRIFHRVRALFLTGVEFHVLPCVLVCFLVEFDLLFAFSVLSLDCASLFIYVHEHDLLCFPMSTE